MNETQSYTNPRRVSVPPSRALGLMPWLRWAGSRGLGWGAPRRVGNVARGPARRGAYAPGALLRPCCSLCSLHCSPAFSLATCRSRAAPGWGPRVATLSARIGRPTPLKVAKLRAKPKAMRSLRDPLEGAMRDAKRSLSTFNCTPPSTPLPLALRAPPLARSAPCHHPLDRPEVGKPFGPVPN